MPYLFDGCVLPFNGRFVLAYGPEASALGVPLLEAPVYVRPAYRSQWPPHDYILPSDVIDDHGNHFSAPDIYPWLDEHGDMFPRSDLLGLTQNGQKVETVVKTLDLVDLALFAGADPAGDLWLKIDLALEARAVPDAYALLPAPFPIPLFDRAVPCYRLAPGVFGAVSAALIGQLLASGQRGLRLTYDQLDDRLRLP